VWPFKKKEVSAPEPVKAPEKQHMNITAEAVATIQPKPAREFQRYEPPKGVIPERIKSSILAMDETPYDMLNDAYMGYGYGSLESFPGYPYLSTLAQKPEYRKMVGTIAEKMTSKWIKLKTVGDDDKSERVKKIIDALERYQVRDKFREAAEHDGYFGGGQIYIDVQSPKNVSAWTDDNELQSKLFLSNKKITKGSLIGFRVIEPVWTYPGVYNAANPLSPDFYRPTEWFVMGKTVHASRMIDFVSRQVPDLLKASYNFRGLSLTQMAEPYVNNWLRTRDSISDLIHSFSVPVIGTNMSQILQGGSADNLMSRLMMFNQCRDNRGAFAKDNDPTQPETVEFVNAPLAGLDALQAQALEQQSVPSSIPLVFLLGITPNGLNASPDGEIRVFYDYIHSIQQAMFKSPLQRVLDVIQLSEFGDIDPDIYFEFEPLYEMTAKEKAEIRKIDADTDAVYVTQVQSLSANDIRQKLADDPDSPYHSLDLSDDIEIEEGDYDEDEEVATENDKGSET
jgi:phage-related protein (TIGR01555 family)